MINAAGALLAGCLALLAAAVAGQSTVNSTEGKLAYVSGLGRVAAAATAVALCHKPAGSKSVLPSHLL